MRLPVRPPEERFVGSSIQFTVPEVSAAQARAILHACKSRGIELKWFGDADPVAFTSKHDSWRYMAPQRLPQTDRVLSGLFDMRLPLTFSVEDCATIGDLIADALAECALAGAA